MAPFHIYEVSQANLAPPREFSHYDEMEGSDTEYGWRRRRRIGTHASVENDINTAVADLTHIPPNQVHRRQQRSNLHLSRKLRSGIATAVARQRYRFMMTMAPARHRAW